MEEKLISVILPVYNGEKYLCRAIESILRQKYTHWELIIINDGSTDASLDISNSFSKTDERIIVIDKANTGVSDTRNIGINKSHGEYILFLDSDDWLDEGFLNRVNEVFNKSDADILIFNYYDVIKDRIEKARRITVSENNNISVREIINAAVRQSQWHNNIWYGNLHTVWAKSFKKSVIYENKLIFNESLRIGEDMVFVLNYILHSKKIYFSNDYVYFYYHNNLSVMNTRRWKGLTQGETYFNEVENLVGNLISESAKADLWLEIAEADWVTILDSDNTIYHKYRIFKGILKDEYYIRFSNNGLDSNIKQKCYAFAIKHNSALLLMFLAYCRMKKHRLND